MFDRFVISRTASSLVAVDDLSADVIWFGSVELELGRRRGDGELETPDLAELGPIGGVLAGRVANRPG